MNKSKHHDEAEKRRRHQVVYGTPRLQTRPFSFDWISQRIVAGRNPLTACDVDVLCAMGVTHVLDLRQPHEWSAPYFGEEALAAMRECGIVRRHLQIIDMGAPTLAALDEAHAFLQKVLAQPETKVYVHCRAGMERTAAILVAFHARENALSYDAALRELQQKRPIFLPLPNQERAVRHWLQRTAQP